MRYPLSSRRQPNRFAALVMFLPLIAIAQDSSLGVNDFYLGPTDSIYKSLVVQSILNANINPTVQASQPYETTYRFSSPELISYCRSVDLQKAVTAWEVDAKSFSRRTSYHTPEPRRSDLKYVPTLSPTNHFKLIR